MRLDQLPTPALLLDLDRLEANLARMAERTRALGVQLRPHIKTHKCVEVATRQRKLGAIGITVSTMHEAQVFADHGFDDITWAFPIPLSRLREAADLSARTRLGIVVDSAAAVVALRESGTPWNAWLKVDCGYHRAGVDPADPEAVSLAQALHESPAITFCGILSHSGHAYNGPTREDVLRAAHEERDVMRGFAARLRSAGIPVPRVSVGSTPAMNVVEDLNGMDEARPGNYAFYDYTQLALGSCGPTDWAVSVLATVVSSRPGQAHSVIDAGALALSKDRGPEHLGRRTMGEIVADYDTGRLESDHRVVSVSQEHGIVNRSLPVGSRVRVLPNHSCLTAAQFDSYHVVCGDSVVDRWQIWRGR